MGRAYPELVRAEALISETLKLEETRFRKTLERGLSLLSDATATLGKGDMLDGETAFKLYDTYGFPLDLTQDALRARGIGVDTRRLHRCDGTPEGRGALALGGLRRQGDRDRSGSSSRKSSAPPNSWAMTPRRPKASSRRSSRMAQSSRAASAGETVQIVVNQTPFYGESGGQMGDTGDHRQRPCQARGGRHAEEGRRSLRSCSDRRRRHDQGRRRRWR